MKKILLLGSNGQLGSDLTKTIKNAHLIRLTRSDFDIEKDTIEKLEKYKDVDYMINATSYHKTDECESFPDKSLKINTSFVYELAKFTKANNIVLFHISTDYVFDGKKSHPYTEADTPCPLNIYGLSKYAGETAISAYAKEYFIFRVSSLFGEMGASGKGGNFVETMISLARKNTPLKVISDQIMSPTHTLDIARAIDFFIENNIKDYGIYHCCNSGHCSWFSFTRKIFELAGIDHGVEQTTYEEYKTIAKRPKYSVLDNAKLSKYYAMKPWEDALHEYLKIKGYVE